MSKHPETTLTLLEDVIASARRAGADQADAVLVSAASLSVGSRLGKLEDVSRSESADIGLRVMIGRQQACVSSTDHSAAALDALVERAVAMARETPEDKFAGLAEAHQLLTGPTPDLDLYDDTAPDTESLFEKARETEDTALAIDGITNSEGAGATWGRHHVMLAASNGLARQYRTSAFSLSAQVIAGEGDAMETDYAYSAARHRADLEGAAVIGRRAGERAVAALGARQVATCQVPVVFSPRTAKSLIGHLAGAVNGRAVARGTSFLKDQMGKALFAPGVSVIDDPTRRRGLSSRPFDAEGLAAGPLDIVSDGVLQCWILDLASARQLGMESNGRAGRGTGAPPSPGTSNLYLAAGDCTPEALIADIERGFYVTGLIGMGVNGVTGDYSRGANGFWIDKGALTYPVNGLTIAGNLKDMYRNMAAADDLQFRYGTDAPTVRIEGMTIAGI